MTEEQLAEIEQALGLKLPPAYRRIVGSLPAALREWPPAPRSGANQSLREFLLDPAALLQVQEAGRQRLGRELPPHSFVIGHAGQNYWLIDTRTDDPPVQLLVQELVLDGFPSLGALLKWVKQRHKEAWKEARRGQGARPTAATTPEAGASMTADELLAEARRMARPATLLKEEGAEEGAEYAAVWKGSGVAPPPAGQWEHWLSFDTRFLPHNPLGLEGVISLYLCLEDGERFEQVEVVHDPAAALPEAPDGQRLFAEPYQCPPPVKALFKFGPPHIQQWLQAHGASADRHSAWQFDPASRQALQALEQMVDREHPFGERMNCVAMLGGWSVGFFWCYGSGEDTPWRLLEKRLVALTFRDSEPWLEVLQDQDRFLAFSRIT